MKGTSLLCISLLAAFATTVNSQCTKTVIPVANYHVSGGTLTANQANSAACQATCFANDNCLGFDWTAASTCWLITAPNSNPIETDTGTTHNRVSYTCPGTCTYVNMGQVRPAVAIGNVVADLNACLTTCNGNAQCLGVTYFTATRNCVVITSATSFTGMTADTTVVTLQALTSTTDSFQAPTGVSRSTCNPARAAAATGCTYTSTANTHGIGGAAQASVTSQAACGQLCYSISGCLAYDWATTAPNCWTFAGNALPTKEAMTGVTHYACQQATQTCYSSVANSHRSNGAPQTGITTDAACKTACSAATTCLAYDYATTATPPCWLHTVAGTVTPDTGTTAYLKIPCTGTACAPTYTRQVNFHGTGSPAPTPNIASETACIAACTTQGQTCTGADWTAAGLCWLHTNTLTGTAIQPETGTVLNIADWSKCTTTTASPNGPTTSAPTASTACTVAYSPRVGFHGIGGVANAAGTTDVLCGDECKKVGQTCQGYDWIPGNAAGRKCWIHTGTAQPSTSAQAGSTYNSAIWTCGVSTASTTTAAPSCTVQWTEYKNQHGVGTPAPTATGTTQALCQDQCIKDSTCLGYDWIFIDTVNAAERCWHHKAQSTIDNKQPSTIINLYVIKSRVCGCQPTYTTTANKHAIGANTPLSTGTTAALCKAACTANSNCIGYDWNANTGVVDSTRCWIHTNAADATNLRDQSGFSFNLIDRSSCTGSSVTPSGPTTACTPTFSSTPDQHGLGVSSPSSTATTQTACQALCVAQATCTAYDFDSSRFTPDAARCWLHVSNNILLAPGPGITFYKIDRTCSPTTAPPTCQPTWNVLNDRHAIGASGPTATGTTLDLCRALCVSNSACVAIDFDARSSTSSGRRCWIHTNPADINNVRNIVQMSLHIIKRGCETQPPGCDPTFTEEKNKHARGVPAPFPTASTAEQCKNQCKSQANCVALDFDTRSTTPDNKRCWVHTNVLFTNNLVSGAGLNFYRIDRTCTQTPSVTPTGCTPSWTETTNQKAVGSPGPTSSATTLSLCRAACIANAQCVGLDYVVAAPPSTRCWLHTNKNDQRVSENGVDYHALSRDCAVCVPTYTEMRNKKAVGSPGPTQSATSATACADACTAQLTCVGYDFNPSATSTQRCWLHTNPNDNIVDAPGLTHYKINRNCVTTGVTSPTVTTGCSPTFSKTSNSHAQGATGPTAAGTTSSACASLCIAMSNCVGYDFVRTSSPNVACWLHTNSNDLNRIEFDANADFYAINRGCATTSPVECVPLFRMEANTFVAGGVVLEQPISSVDECKWYCSGQANCLGVVVRTTGNTIVCLVITQASSLSQKSQSVDYTFYQLTARCPREVTVPTAPAPGGCQFDIVIFVDSSGSIRDGDLPPQNSWETVKNWLREIVTDIGAKLHLNGIRLSVITFSNYAQVRWDLDDRPTMFQQLDAINNVLSYAGGSTNTGLAFVRAVENVFTPGGGDRLNVPNLLVLMTDGKTTMDQGMLVGRRNNLQARVPGDYYAIGVTDNVDLPELNAFAKGIANNVYQVDQVDQLISRIVTQRLVGCSITAAPTRSPTQAPINTRRPLV